MKSIILAAGVGKRIGRKLPKCLTPLPTGKTILENQIELLKANGLREIIVVVGFKKELIMEYYPQVLYLYNPLFHVTNTSKSLMLALEYSTPDDIIWLNGDVYFEEEVLRRVLAFQGNAVAVNHARCGEEEVKYRTDEKGRITALSKTVHPAEGEAVGINKISRSTFPLFLEKLRACGDHDYFEKAMEMSIAEGHDFYAVDISDLKCVEIDFRKDLEMVRKFFKRMG